MAYIVQKNSALLYLVKMPGNMFINGIIWGCGEVFAMFFSGWLMGRMHDVTAFRVVYLIGAIGYSILIFFSDSEYLPYFGLLMLITSTGGWVNTLLLILELRVPPQNIASVSVIIKSISVMAGIASPTIAALPKSQPLIVMATIAFFAMILTFCLPEPGLHLPSA